MKYIGASALLLAVCVLFISYARTDASQDGVPAQQQFATTTEVGPQQTKTLFSSNTTCGNRVIRTVGQDVQLLFADPTNGNLASTTLTHAVGFFQAASTTISYDSKLYGCGRVTAEATASTTITTAEFF